MPTNSTPGLAVAEAMMVDIALEALGDTER